MERTFRNSQAVCMQQRGCFAACKVLLLCCHPALLCWSLALVVCSKPLGIFHLSDLDAHLLLASAG
jgi:hypothetical protein